MYRADKITDIEKITTGGIVEKKNSPFYILIVPKGSESNVAMLQGKLLESKETKTIPVLPNCWNPVVIRSIEVSEGTLGKYDVFIGTEG